MVTFLKRLKVSWLLIWRLLYTVLLSAWDTSKIILTDSATPNRGVASFKYGDLSKPGVVVLSMFVSLTPGTSVLEIDTEQCVLVLHLLDTSNLESTMKSLENTFLVPISYLFGGRSSS